MNFKKLFSLLLVSVCALFVVACNKNTHTVTLSETSLELIVGDTATLTATVNPDDATVTWSSTDATVVSVVDGALVANKVGTAIIKAAVSDKEYATCSVTVKKRDVQPTVVLSKDNVAMKLNGTYTLVATCMAGTEVATDATFTFSSSDAETVSVDTTGKLTALKEGSATITVVVSWDEKTAQATAEVTVTADAEIKVTEEAYELSLLELNADDKKTAQIDASVWYAEAETADAITYESSNNDVATVSTSGLITAVGVGTTTIVLTATTNNKELTKEIDVEVIKTSQSTFTVSADDYASKMVTKALNGYYNEQTLKFNVEPYAEGLNIQWSIEGTGATIAQGTDPRECTVLVDAASKGTTFKVTAVLEGNSDYTCEYDIRSYIGIGSEADLWAMNDLMVDNKITGDFLLTADIVCQNNDPANSSNGAYTSSIIGRMKDGTRKTFKGCFDGNGYTISNIKFTGNNLYVGLFGHITDDSVVKNLGVEVVSFGNGGMCGAIAGWMECFNANSYIMNCSVKANVSTSNYGAGTWANGAVLGRIEGWGSHVDNNYVEITGVANGAANQNNIGIVGRAYYQNYMNNYVVVTQNAEASKVSEAGKTEGANGKHEGNVFATSNADLITKGMTKASFPEAVFNVDETTGVVTLKKGCTQAAYDYLIKGADITVVAGKTANVEVTTNVTGLTYTSSDEAVATVVDGVVTGVAQGTCTITVAKGELSVVINVTVEKAPDVEVGTAVDAVELNYYNLSNDDVNEVNVGAKILVDKAEATGATFEYAVADTTVAAVSTTGVVTPLKVGTTKLTITATYESKTYTKELDITVTASHVTTLTITAGDYAKIMIDHAVDGYVNEQTVAVTVTPWDDKMAVTWTSSWVGVAAAALSDTKNCKLTGTNNNGNTVKVTASVAGFEGKAELNIEFYRGIATEEDIWAMNTRNWAKVKDIDNNEYPAIAGSYLLLNDIVLENDDPNNMNTYGTTTVYKNAPIGRGTGWKSGSVFIGTFDGNGYTISNLVLDLNNAYGGLFYAIGPGGTVKNLKVETGSYTHAPAFPNGNFRKYSGALCGQMFGNAGAKATVTNCYIKTQVMVDCGSQAEASGAICYLEKFWNTYVTNNVVELTPARCYQDSSLASFNVGIVGKHDNGTLANNYVIVTQNADAAKGVIVGTESANAAIAANTKNNILATSWTDLVTKGFTVSMLDSKVWNVTIEEGTATVSLKRGSTLMAAPTVKVDATKDVREQRTVQLTAVTTGDAGALTWISTDTAVATVDENGLVTGVAPGTTTITVKYGLLEATCTVTVNAKAVVVVTAEALSDINVYKLAEADVDERGIAAETTVAGVKYTDATYTYTVADNTVATVSALGVVSGLKVGTTKVTVSTVYDGDTYTYDVDVNIVASTVTELTITASAYNNVMIDHAVTGYCNTQDVSVTVTPWDDKMAVTWTSGWVGITASAGTDTKTATLTGVNQNGNNVAVTAKVDGFTGSATFNITFYRAIAAESDIWAMNSRNWAKVKDINNNEFSAIGGLYLLCNDIVLANNDPANSTTVGSTTVYSTAPIGKGTAWNNGSVFIGTFDGNGYTISNLTIAMGNNYSGLFYGVGPGGTVKNLRVETGLYEYSTAFPHASARKYSGAICGQIFGNGSAKATITNCYIKANVFVDCNSQAEAGGAICYLESFWNTSIDHNFVELTPARVYENSTLASFNVGIVGKHDNGALANNYVVVTQNADAAKGVVVGTESTNTTVAGYTKNNILATSLTDLVTQGFTADMLSSTVWNVSVNEGTATVALKNGCSVAKAN